MAWDGALASAMNRPIVVFLAVAYGLSISFGALVGMTGGTKAGSSDSL
jgi:hypothetical protein